MDVVYNRLDSLGAVESQNERNSTTSVSASKPAVRETPGDVLGNFFLNYKKDRMEILTK